MGERVETNPFEAKVWLQTTLQTTDGSVLFVAKCLPSSHTRRIELYFSILLSIYQASQATKPMDKRDER